MEQQKTQTADEMIGGAESGRRSYFETARRLLMNVLRYSIVSEDDLDNGMLNRPSFDGDPGDWFPTAKGLLS